MTQLLEKEIWVQISKGDKSAYGKCYVFYYKKLFNYGRKFTDNIALLEDALQESLMAIWSGRDRLDKINTPHSYLFAVFRHILFRKINLANKLRSIDRPESPTPEFGIEHIIIAQEEESEMSQRLRQSMEALTSRQREAIFLRFYEGLSYEEVADMLDISVKATYKIMARALLQLKTNLSLPMLGVLLLLRNSAGF
jgi:RNA polymerase sigma factor (sigma-70 family)